MIALALITTIEDQRLHSRRKEMAKLALGKVIYYKDTSRRLCPKYSLWIFQTWWIAEGSTDQSEVKPWELDFISSLKRANPNPHF